MLYTKTALVTTDLRQMSEMVEKRLRDHRGKYLFQGILFVVFGILAAVLPSVAALNIALLVGIVLLTTGVLQFILTLKAKTHWWSLLSAGLSIFFGLLVLWKPLDMLMVIVTLMAIFLTLEGIIELLLAFQFRPLRNWSWMFFSGLITLVMALILWMGYPTIGVLYLGWVVAINLILYGVSLIMLVWRVTGAPE